MIYFLYGLLGFFVSAVIFAAGIFVGWKAHARSDRPPTPKELGEVERKRLIAEQNAFRAMMSYSPEIAYGFDKIETESEGDDST